MKSRKNHISAFICERIYKNLNSIVQQIYSLSYFIDNSIALFTPGGGSQVIGCFFTFNFSDMQKKMMVSQRLHIDLMYLTFALLKFHSNTVK